MKKTLIAALLVLPTLFAMPTGAAAADGRGGVTIAFGEYRGVSHVRPGYVADPGPRWRQRWQRKRFRAAPHRHVHPHRYGHRIVRHYGPHRPYRPYRPYRFVLRFD